MVVDTSPRMQYVRQNKTRLEEATEIAGKLLNKFPEDTQVAVVDLGRAAGGFARDLGTARTRLSNLRTSPSTRPLSEVAAEAIALVADKEEYRQEVFLYTDLSAAAWSEEEVQNLNAALEAEPEVKLYLVDVGVEEPTNRTLGDLEIRRTVLRPGESLHVEASLEGRGGEEASLVELWLKSSAGDELEKRGQQIVKSSAESEASSQKVSFDVSDLPLGTHQAVVKLTSTDPLMIDNERYFTVEVRPPERVLIVAENKTDALFAQEALNPTLWDQPLRFVCETTTFDALPQAELNSETKYYKTVLALDPPPLGADGWQQLTDFANQGGGLGIFLGHNASREPFNAKKAQELLPGPIVRKSRDATYLRPKRLDHPALVELRDY
ncbi:MAG: VWA domain-containing protein, partial [Lacipirellulaceae bacterium]